MEKINIWDILFWIIMIILLILVLTKMFGSSATEVQIYLGFISSQIIIVGYILKLMNNSNNLNIQVSNIENNMKDSFGKVKVEIKEIKENLQKISKKLKIK